MERNAMVAMVWEAMKALPKPVTGDQALAAALAVLSGKPSGDFVKWFEEHGEYVVGRLNV